MEKRHHNYQAKFFSHSRNTYIPLGRDRRLSSFENYKTFLKDIDDYLSSNLNENFQQVNPPKLVLSLRWKHVI